MHNFCHGVCNALKLPRRTHNSGTCFRASVGIDSFDPDVSSPLKVKGIKPLRCHFLRLPSRGEKKEKKQVRKGGLFNIERRHKSLILMRRITWRRFYLPGGVVLLWTCFEGKYIPRYNKITFPSRLFIKVIKNGEVTIQKCIQDHIILTEVYSTGLLIILYFTEGRTGRKFSKTVHFMRKDITLSSFYWRKWLQSRRCEGNKSKLIICKIFQFCNNHARVY
jgi:hypothetical protein